MTYRELKDKFCEHNMVSDKPIFAHIVFTKDSFQREYTEIERTYIVSSRNKAFMSNICGYSIFGCCLDGNDPDARLDLLMKAEKGGKDGWVVEDCYLI